MFVYTPLPQYGDEIYKVQLVMTKEIFQECYKKWIKQEESEETTIEETINRLNKLRSIHNGSYAKDIDMAIKALEQKDVLDKVRTDVEAIYGK